MAWYDAVPDSPGAGTTAPARVMPDAADTPALADTAKLIVCTSSSPVTITADDLGGYVAYGVLQAGAGPVTIAAGDGVTLVSDKPIPSFATARRGAVLTIVCSGAGDVFVIGNTA